MTDRGSVLSRLSERPRAVDTLVAVLVLTAFEMPAFDPYRHAGGPIWPLWGLAIAVALLWRRRHPILVTAVSVAALIGALATRTGPDWGGLGPIALDLGPAVALGWAAAALSRASSIRIVLIVEAAILVTGIVVGFTPDVIVAQLALIAAAWTGGEAVRARRHEMTIVAEQGRERAERAVTEERNRIARELHDVLAHQLAVISLHAGAARLQPAGGPSQTRSLQTVETACRGALDDLRRALGVLRIDPADDPADDDPAAALAPTGSLDQLPQLTARLADAGLPLRVAISGDLSRISARTSHTAYRIIQESLTNVLNHAGPTPTELHVDCDSVRLRLVISNGAPGPDRDRKRHDGPPGRGLIGMRERAHACGGTFRAGPTPGGGFTVAADMPVP